MQEELYIIKIGGETLNSETSLRACIEAIAFSQKRVILVHGGGRKVTELASKLGIEQTMVDGRRITSAETLELCTMVYAGLINKNIVAQLSAQNVLSVGLTGADFNSVLSAKRQHPTLDFGMVGDVKRVNTSIFHKLLTDGVTPVVCSITLGENAHLLNTNADTIASEVAKALTAHYDVKLVYCFEKNGVLLDVNNPDSVVRLLTPEIFEQMISKKQIADGMLPKLQTAFNALENGVKEVKILNSNNLKSFFECNNVGTSIQF